MSEIIKFIHKRAPRVVLMVKNPAKGGGTDLGWIPGSGRYPGVGSSNLLQYCCLESPMDRGACGYSPWRHKELDMTEQNIV